MYSEVIDSRNDRQILQGLLDRDPRALHAACDEHRGAVFGVARRVLRDWSGAEDVSQEVFIALWEHPDRVDLSRGTLRVFLTKVARFRAVDLVRSEEARHRREERVSVSRLRLTQATDADLVAGTVIDVDTDRWSASALRHALSRLPEPQQKAVELAYFAGHTYREVGAILAIPEGTAKSRLRASLAALGRSLPAAVAESDARPGLGLPVTV